jgi:hypothetical protein
VLGSLSRIALALRDVRSAGDALVSPVDSGSIEPIVAPASHGNVLRISEIGFERRDNNASPDFDQLDPRYRHVYPRVNDDALVNHALE